MRMRSLGLPMLLAAPAGLWMAGGWAVVTVENPPQSMVAGVPYEIRYTVRQHGITLLSDLHGSVEASFGRSKVSADSKSSGAGKYAATITIPDAGDWTITVQSGFGLSKTTLLPLKVTKAGSATSTMTDVERGRHLFAAKGCATCHVEMKVVPDPRNQTFDERFVRQLLKDPASVPPRRNVGIPMPNLGLSTAEIEALTAYLAGPNPAGTR